MVSLGWLSNAVITCSILMAVYVQTVAREWRWYKPLFVALAVMTASISIALKYKQQGVETENKIRFEKINSKLIEKTDDIQNLQKKLLAVTEEEAALVFEPQVMVSYGETLFKIENLGKSTVCILGLNIAGEKRITYDKPQCIIPRASMSFYPEAFEPSARNIIGLNGRKDITAQFLVRNQRDQFYLSEWLLQIFVNNGKVTINPSENYTYRIKRSQWED